jgi:hypothetical protein
VVDKRYTQPLKVSLQKFFVGRLPQLFYFLGKDFGMVIVK